MAIRSLERDLLRDELSENRANEEGDEEDDELRALRYRLYGMSKQRKF